MRICVISFHSCPFSPIGGDGVGGMNVYLKELSSALSRCPQTRIDIFTRAQGTYHQEVKSVAPNVRVIHLPAGPACSVDRRRLFEYLPEFTENLKSFCHRTNKNYDILYSHYWLSGLVGEELKHCLNIPLVQTYHTLSFLKSRVSGELEHRSRRLVEEHLAHVSDLIISTSSEEKKSLIEEYGIPNPKIEVIYPGVNHELFYPLLTETLFEDTGFSKKDNVLLYVGRIEPVKGLMTIIDSLDVLNGFIHPLGRTLRLVVIGGGNKEDELFKNHEVVRIRKTVEQKGLTDSVVFLGSKPQSVLKEYYSAADALVVPSLYESFGLVVVESLACGTPVLVSSVGKMKTIVKEGRNGFSFAPGQPLSLAGTIQEFVLGKNQLWDGRTIRQDIIDKFSWEKAGKETFQVLLALKEKNLYSTRKFQPDEIPRLA
jgi:D-inositol-3-phosphate glycosyltransferase